MYDWPELRAETDGFWCALRHSLAQAGLPAPDVLSRPEDVTAPWRDPDLVIGQTCGFPLIHGLAEPSVAFACPTYAVEGCGPGNYRSAFLARRDGRRTLADFRGSRAAVNGWDSQSGYNALAHALSSLPREEGFPPEAPFFASVTLSGAHRRSASLVAGGEADLCALDAVAWALFQRFEPDHARRLTVIGWSAEAPALPFVTSPRFADRAPVLLQALQRALEALPPCPALPVSVRRTSRSDYRVIRDMARQSSALTMVQ